MTVLLGKPRIFAASAILFLLIALMFVYMEIPAGHAAFPGANGKIAFTSTRDGNSEIYVMNADGTGQINLTTNPDLDYTPVWSPDGSNIVFTRFQNGNWEIYVMNADGSNQVRLTNNSSDDIQPTWSPDGTRIAFESRRDGNWEVYVMNADGSNQANLSNNPAEDGYSVSWGTTSKIAFMSTRDGNPEIYVMNYDGSSQTRLTNNTGWDIYPAWSPDGNKIAFSRRCMPCDPMASSGIYVMDADGSNQTVVTNDFSDLEPAWSPDGSKIVFTSNPNPPGMGESDIYVVNADGSGQINLTNNPASDSAPDWQPLSPKLTVQIDIKPGSDPSCFNNDGNGVIPVAILGSADFDVATIDPATVRLEGMAIAMKGKTNKYLAAVEDINGDGYVDLVVKIEDIDGFFLKGSGTAMLTGNLYPEYGGTPIEGVGDICVTQ